jgi:hypothetical protein
LLGLQWRRPWRAMIARNPFWSSQKNLLRLSPRILPFQFSNCVAKNSIKSLLYVRLVNHRKG